MKRFLISVAAAAALFAQPALLRAQAPTEGASLPASAGLEMSAPGIASQTRVVSLGQLSNQAVITLRTTEGSHTIAFGSRADELVTRILLRLRYTYSPALIPGLSHIKVALNEENVGVVPITKENAGRAVIHEIEIDPRFVADFNRLKLQFVGHYASSCEDPLHSSLWADISSSSELAITSRPLSLKNDLAMLPEPFFDKRDLRRLDLPFVFAAAPGRPTLNAAGIVSSWFGQLAAWRGARFPSYLGRLPGGHAVVFATNTERPPFLDQHRDVKGPTLEVITNPADGYSKLLLILGRDGGDLKIAAQALVLGSAALSGPLNLISGTKAHAPRRPYDAPNWVRVDRPMKFGELVASPQELQVFGHVPEPVRISVRIPPDLFTWRSRGVPVDLKYRYTPPIRTSESRLTMAINDELVQSFNLRESGQGGDSTRVRLPLLDDVFLGDSKEVFIPAFKLGARNVLKFGFTFSYQRDNDCGDTLVENVRAMVDADSRLDFSGFPHYAEMPNLNYFVTAGYPFTKYADLAQTVVVLPENPSAHDIEAMLTLLGRMGESTGYPATRFRLAAPADEAQFRDADLLIIGAFPGQSLLGRWSGSLPAGVSGGVRHISHPVRGVNFLYDWLGFDTDPDPAVAAQEKIEGDGALAALLGFESPVTPERSAVAVTAATSEQLAQVLDALENPGLTRSMYGSVAFIHPNKVESLLVGRIYSVGQLPFWTAIWFPLSEHPVLLAAMAIPAVLVFAFALWRTLRAVAAKRMKEDA